MPHKAHKSGKAPRARSTKDELHRRQLRAYELWLQGHGWQSIADQLTLELGFLIRDTEAIRYVGYVRKAIARLQATQPLLELQERLTHGALADLADSHRMAQHAEGHPDEKFGVDYKSISHERATRAKIRANVATLNGLDKLEVKVDWASLWVQEGVPQGPPPGLRT